MTNAQIRHENIVYRTGVKMWRGNYMPAQEAKPEPAAPKTLDEIRWEQIKRR